MRAPHRSNRPKHAMARLRQLAQLQIRGPELIGPVLATLHQAIGFDCGGYIYPRSDGELDVYMENPQLQAAMPEYFEPHILRSEQQVLVRSTRMFEDAVRHEHGVQMLPQLIRVSLPELRRSDFYNTILRPGGVDDVLSLALRTPQGRGIGILKLYRRAAERPFSADDAATLARLEPWLARALHPDGQPDEAQAIACSEGLLIASPLGKLQWASADALGLMLQAFPTHWRGPESGALPPAVQLLLQKARTALAAPPQATADPLRGSGARLSLRSARGWFSLHATPLGGIDGRDDAVALRIARVLPAPARTLATLDALGLPPRQRELAYWLAAGLSEAKAAERMGISGHTAIYHRRELYGRLLVASRQELLARLGMQPPCAAPETAPGHR